MVNLLFIAVGAWLRQGPEVTLESVVEDVMRNLHDSLGVAGA